MFNDTSIRFCLIYPSRSIWQKRFFPIINKILDTTDYVDANLCMRIISLKYFGSVDQLRVKNDDFRNCMPSEKLIWRFHVEV